MSKCTYHGFVEMPPGKRFECPACGLTITAILRDGRSWIGKHTRKERANSYRYQHCHAGSDIPARFK